MTTLSLTALAIAKLQNHELADFTLRSLKDFDQKGYSLEDDLSLTILAQLRQDTTAFKKSLEVQHLDQNTTAITGSGC